MGQFSWITSDTSQSIWSDHKHPPVFMRDDKGNVWREDNYEGYGEFGGKDYYALVANMNGIDTGNDDEDRSAGIDMVFEDNPAGRPMVAVHRGIKLPTLAHDVLLEWEELTPPEGCPHQGWYPECEDDWE